MVDVKDISRGAAFCQCWKSKNCLFELFPALPCHAYVALYQRFWLTLPIRISCPHSGSRQRGKRGESEGAGREVTKWGAALLMLARLHWNTQWSYSNGKTHALPSMLTTRWRAQLDGERERERRRGLDSRCTYSRGSRAMLEASAEKPLRWDGWGKVAQHLQPAGNWSIWKGGRKLNPRQVFNIVLSWKDLLNRSYRNSYTLKNYFNVFKLIWILGIVIQLTYQTLVVF